MLTYFVHHIDADSNREYFIAARQTFKSADEIARKQVQEEIDDLGEGEITVEDFGNEKRYTIDGDCFSYYVVYEVEVSE